jgi:cell division protease FtsH
MQPLEGWPLQGRRGYSEATAREIDLATRALVEAALTRAGALLGEKRSALERGAAELLARETLSGAQVKALLDAGA